VNSSTTKCALCGGDHARSKCPWDTQKDNPMKTVIYGPVEPHHLEDAEFIAGITPTRFLSNGHYLPPPSNIPVDVDPPSPMLPGELGEKQRNYSLLLQADALICVGGNPHLVRIANDYKLPIYEVEQ
jgi:hypothetical protein